MISDCEFRNEKQKKIVNSSPRIEGKIVIPKLRLLDYFDRSKRWRTIGPPKRWRIFGLRFRIVDFGMK